MSRRVSVSDGQVAVVISIAHARELIGELDAIRNSKVHCINSVPLNNFNRRLKEYLSETIEKNKYKYKRADQVIKDEMIPKDKQ